jgi:hypothetical protein
VVGSQFGDLDRRHQVTLGVVKTHRVGSSTHLLVRRSRPSAFPLSSWGCRRSHVGRLADPPSLADPEPPPLPSACTRRRPTTSEVPRAELAGVMSQDVLGMVPTPPLRPSFRGPTRRIDAKA